MQLQQVKAGAVFFCTLKNRRININTLKQNTAFKLIFHIVT